MSLTVVFGHCHPQKAEPRSCSETVELTEPTYLLSGSYTVSFLISMMLRFLNNRCFPASREEALAMLLTSEPEGSRPRWAPSGPDFWAQAILVGKTPAAAEEADRARAAGGSPELLSFPLRQPRAIHPANANASWNRTRMGAVLMRRDLRRERGARGLGGEPGPGRVQASEEKCEF